ncbi:sensor histidine kinase [Allorhizocola rhizosphaerae]|uniref:sensor histidine kinase n=1 Tax=Allorhizocola rhizosphaerae TaxID=1872709 RepID=UPI000E3DB94D|nr:histidine kinase [Allorhizocola rhizosphaerae]
MIRSWRAVLAVTVVLTAVFVVSGGWDRAHVARDVVLIALNTLPLLLLRHQPVAAVLVICAAYPAWLVAGHEASMFQSLPMLAALYASGAWAKPLWVRAIALVAPVWCLYAVLSGWWEGAGLGDVGYIVVMFVLMWTLGVVVAALEAARRELADRAVLDERARIARELHDVIAHAMSVITVRAGVGAHLIESRPREAAEALSVIERTGREALTEMRRMLTVLRDPHPHAPQQLPQPGLADVLTLVEHVRAAGVAVAVTTAGKVRALPAGLDLAAYRIIQEALTNVVKHAPGTKATILMRYQDEALRLEIGNAASGPAGPITPGQGMRGMAERAALYDGNFEAGPDGEGGFRVAVTFPT